MDGTENICNMEDVAMQCNSKERNHDDVITSTDINLVECGENNSVEGEKDQQIQSMDGMENICNMEAVAMQCNSNERNHDDVVSAVDVSVVEFGGNNNVEGEKVQHPEPVDGMLFDSAQAAKTYYLNYAKSTGFEIAVRDSHYGDNGMLYRVKYACSRGGVVRRKTDKVHNMRPSSKVNCPACLSVVRREEGYFVTKVVLEHTHELTLKKGPHFRSKKGIGATVRKRLQSNELVSIRPSKNCSSLAAEEGAYEQMTYSEDYCKNHLQNKRLELGGGDGVVVMEFFNEYMREDKNFFYNVELNEEGQIRSLFWVDGKARAAYKYFSDVIGFDTTRFAKAIEMLYASFVGVNHHGKTIILGSGLLANETVASFVWLFRSWLNCMGGIQPKGIITNQCKAIQKAINIVCPDVRHRLCQFHITSKLGEKLKSHREYKEIKAKFDDAVFNSLSREEFEETWNSMITFYKLEANRGLNSLYSIRHMWVPAFVKDFFWAGMSNTQRSEGMNKFFGGFVNSLSSLRSFLSQYGTAMAKKAEDEAEDDFRSTTSTIECVSDFCFEKQFQEAYTHDKFREFQKQVRKANGKYPKVEYSEGTMRHFLVRDKVEINGSVRHIDYSVKYEEDTAAVSCNCLLFDFSGVLCSHAISVLGYEGVEQVNSRYILDRWRKDVRRLHSYVKCAYTPARMRASVETFGEFLPFFEELMLDAFGNPQRLNYLRNILKDARHKLAEIKEETGCNTPNMDGQDNVSTGNGGYKNRGYCRSSSSVQEYMQRSPLSLNLSEQVSSLNQYHGVFTLGTDNGSSMYNGRLSVINVFSEVERTHRTIE